MSVRTGVAGLVVVVFTLAGCGVPVDGEVHSFPPDAIPYGLAESPSTSSPAPSTSIVVPEVIGGTPAGRAETIVLYFVADGQLISQPRSVGAPVAPWDLMSQLAEGPEPADYPLGVRSVVRVEHVKSISVRAGVGTLELAPAFIALAPAERRLAVAQLVLTLTSRPGIGQVLFSADGQPLDVPRGDGSLLKGSVSRDDYVRLIQ